MDLMHSFPRPSAPLRASRRSGLALVALCALLCGGVPAVAGAQSIDEPGVHLVDPRSGQGNDGNPQGPGKQGQDKPPAQKPPPSGGPGRAYCAGRPGGDARPDDCVDVQARDRDLRRESIEAAKRSDIEVGTHVRDRMPQRPVQRNH